MTAAAPLSWIPRTARAAGELRDTAATKIGTTLTFGLTNGPFPHPDAPYDDDSCLVFVPSHYRAPASGRIDAMVHFHGHGTTAKKTIVEKDLREQFHASGQNAILIVPQGPIDAKDSRWGKLDGEGGFLAMLGEVRRAMQKSAVNEALGLAAMSPAGRIGTTVVSAHSGGYRAAASCLRHGGWNVNETWLFDALYGLREEFLAWVLERRDRTAPLERHKLLAWYGVDAVKAQCRKLREELDGEGLAYVHVTDEAKAVRAQMVRARIGFIRSKVGHRQVMHASNALRDCLTWSCFERSPAAPKAS
jgi:hypothetical protein